MQFLIGATYERVLKESSCERMLRLILFESYNINGVVSFDIFLSLEIFETRNHVTNSWYTVIANKSFNRKEMIFSLFLLHLNVLV